METMIILDKVHENLSSLLLAFIISEVLAVVWFFARLFLGKTDKLIADNLLDMIRLLGAFILLTYSVDMVIPKSEDIAKVKTEMVETLKIENNE